MSGSGPERGQSTAELAMLLPIVILLLLAVVQVGLVARDYVAVHQAVGDAARHAALEPDRSAVASRLGRVAPSLKGERLQVVLTGDRGRGGLVTVRLRYRSPTGVPLVGPLVGDVALSAVAVARVE